MHHQPPGFPPPVLAPAPEPTALGRRMRTRAEEAPAQARAELAEGRWLAPWLWVMGERQWPEVASLLYGGTLRRAAHPSGA